MAGSGSQDAISQFHFGGGRFSSQFGAGSAGFRKARIAESRPKTIREGQTFAQSWSGIRERRLTKPATHLATAKPERPPTVDEAE